MTKRIIRIGSLIIVTLLIQTSLSAQSEGKDSGYLFSGPHIVEETKELANGLILEANHQKGVFVTDNPESPWYHATFLSQGTTVRHKDGRTINDVAIMETVDKDGDITWSHINMVYGKQPYHFYFISGTGKWEGISGKGIAMPQGMESGRADDHFMPTWEIEWEVKPKAE